MGELQRDEEAEKRWEEACRREGHRQLNELGGEGRVSAGHVDSP